MTTQSQVRKWQTRLASRRCRVDKRDLETSSIGLKETSTICTQIRKCQENNIMREALTLFLGNLHSCGLSEMPVH